MSRTARTKFKKKTMSKIKTLETYTVALGEVSDFREKNEKVFGELDSLKIAVQEAEEELKKDVKENHKMNIANEFIKVTYSPAFHKGYRYDVIIEQATPKIKKALEEGKVITHNVDTKGFEDLVEKGIVPVELKQAAFEEKELAPRVTIKEVKKNEQENDN